EDPVGAGEGVVGGPELAVGGVGVLQVGLGRERVGRPGGQHDVVGVDLLPRRRLHPTGVHPDGPVPDHPAVGEQGVVGQEHLVQPGRVHQGPEGGHVVQEGLLRLHQHHVGHLVQGLGHGRPAVPAADDGHRRSFAHCSSCPISCCLVSCCPVSFWPVSFWPVSCCPALAASQIICVPDDLCP